MQPLLLQCFEAPWGRGGEVLWKFSLNRIWKREVLHLIARFSWQKSRPAASCTCVAHQHDGGRSCAFLTAPALANVWTPGYETCDKDSLEAG